MKRSEFMQEYEGINFLLDEIEERRGILLEKKNKLENMIECSICYRICSPEVVKKIDTDRVCASCIFLESRRKKETRKISKEEFLSKVGREPHRDDLERVNCSEAGKLGHQSCGWCSNCSLPVFECNCEVIRNEDGSYITKKKYLFL